MSWYFLTEAIVPSADALPVFMRNRIPAMTHTIQKPTVASGVAFEVRDDQMVDDLLELIGIGHIDFRVLHTDQDGILFLEKEKVRKRAAEAPPDKPEVGGAAFARNVLAQERALRVQQDEALAKMKAEAAEAERAFFVKVRAFHDAVEQLALNAGVASQDEERLQAEHDAILKDPRVATVVTTATQLVVDTNPLVLESEPRRFLGRFRVTIGTGDGSFLVAAQDRLAEYPHPCVSKRGLPYFGTLRDALIRRIGGHEYATVVRIILDFLQEPPTIQTIGAMVPERWPEVDADGTVQPMAARSPRTLTPATSVK